VPVEVVLAGVVPDPEPFEVLPLPTDEHNWGL
jgi:hypothetical protein